MAGAGYKLFNTGDVLTAAQVNTYLQEQVVMRFANATARTTALSGVLAEGMVCYLDDVNEVQVYNGSTWVSVGNTGDITGVTAGTGLSGGGTSGDVTLSLSTPVSATNGGTAQTTYTTGDLLYASAANTLAKRAIGSTGQVLTVSGGVPTWATPASGGKILQVVQATNTATQSTTSTSYVDAITVNITPSSTSSRILITGFIAPGVDTASTQCAFRLVKDSTAIFVGDASGSRNQATGVVPTPGNNNYSSMASVSFVDSPATTSQITYKVQYKVDSGATTTIYLGRSFNDNGAAWSSRVPSAGIICMEIGA